MLRKIEWVLIMVAVCAFILKMLHFLPASPVLIIAMCSLTMFYFIISVSLLNGMTTLSANSFAKLPQWRIPVSILVGICISFIPIGLIFKLFFWSGGESYLPIGLAGTIGGICLSAFFLFTKKDISFRPMFNRCVCWAMVALFFFLLPTNTYIDFYFRKYPDYGNALKEYIANPDDPAIQRKWNAERVKLDSLQNVKQ